MSEKLKNYEDLPALMGAKDLQQILPLSRAGIYNLVNTEGFPVIRIGKRVVIPKDGFIEWLSKNTCKEA